MAILPGPPAPRSHLPHHVKKLLVRRMSVLRLLLLHRAFLSESGWLASGRTNTPVDRDGNPLPWYTYPAAHFLAGRVHSDMAVFEYGAGNSTLWWANKVAHVASVESDAHWVSVLTPRLLPNVDLRLEAPGSVERYAQSANGRERKFDIVVIDGIERNACAYACLPALNPGGVIIWDNSDWMSLWADGMAYLEVNGFRRLDFRGLGPIAWQPWTTSIFYRRGDNCFQI